jgi:hypothetical protein
VLSVPARGRLVLRASNGRRAELRSLSEAPITDLGVIPVLASQLALAIGEGTAELPTERGVVYVPAQLHRDGRLELTVTEPVRPLQRRADGRCRIELPLRGTAAGSHRVGLLGLVQRTELAGRTVDVSAGGLCARLEPSELAGDVAELYVELDGDGPRPIGAVLAAVALRSGLLRARFTVLAAADCEYLARRTSALERTGSPSGPPERLRS